MFQILHPDRVFRALYYGTRWRLKRLLRIPEKPYADVINGGYDMASKRYRRICETILMNLPKSNSLDGGVAAEIGCGDCLAAADMMLGLGARHVHLIEYFPIVVTGGHAEALKPLVDDPMLPNQGEIFASDCIGLNAAKTTAHQGLLENVGIPEPVDLVYSFDVLEHVEDLEGFFACCAKMLRPGGISLHKFDLSGHEYFEDPLPPLDFQTYPTWLFNLIFPKYRRAVGNFADTIMDAMRDQGLVIMGVVPIRKADPDYLDEIWPRLRKEARLRSREVVSLLDVIVIAQKIRE
jgi:SAM-dependent methyltransferase